MNVMILVWGSSNRGKSQCLKELAKNFQFSSIVRPWTNDDYDSYVIGKVKDRKGEERVIGIESQGDPGTNQEVWINSCIDKGCEVIVAACRSYGDTYNTANRLAKQYGYEVIEMTTMFHGGGPLMPNGLDLRKAFAESVHNLIMMCLEQ